MSDQDKKPDNSSNGPDTPKPKEPSATRPERIVTESEKRNGNRIFNTDGSPKKEK